MLWEQLNVDHGILCLTGSGGKTTLAHVLARQLPGTVLFCTTTRIWPSDTLPVLENPTEAELQAALRKYRTVCAGVPAERGKLSALPIPMADLARLADYVVVEADGSKNLPLKAHLDYEPVIPMETGRTILLVGASGFSQPIARAAHRPERFAELCGADMEDAATPERVARVLRREGGFDAVVVNQVTDEGRHTAAKTMAAALECPVFAGEVLKGILTRLS